MDYIAGAPGTLDALKEAYSPEKTLIYLSFDFRAGEGIDDNFGDSSNPYSCSFWTEYRGFVIKCHNLESLPDRVLRGESVVSYLW
jgi:hypothetical protein